MNLRSITLAFGVGVAALAGTGCVERTITIETDPPGALVYLNDEEAGRSPLTVPFTWYGTYDVRIERDGYQTISTAAETAPPWHEHPGPDLLVELLPWTTEVKYHWQYELVPNQPADPEALTERARALRGELQGESD